MTDEFAIRMEDLSKTFGRGGKRVRAVKDLNLNIGTGQVYGFLGPNGAGKTTTIRLILDLIRPTQGSVYVYGRHVRHQHSVLRRVGAIVERAAFYHFLSGRRNLEVIASVGDYESDKIPTLLEGVDLTDHADMRVGKDSTGMKQRLGLAAALLGDPELLILDEPTNGLDPAGMHEVRNFLRGLVDDHGKTIFLSSHLLSEVEQICDRVAIIHRGVVVREGRVTDLLSRQSQLRLLVSPMEAAEAMLGEQWPIADQHILRDSNDQTMGWLTINAGDDEAPHIVRLLAEQGIDVFQVTPTRQSLESYFLQATQGGEERV
jgi:ABC-2 type transport system ATP-binding protein